MLEITVIRKSSGFYRQDSMTIYTFSDGSKVRVDYDHDFGYSLPSTPCNAEQQIAIFAYLDKLLSEQQEDRDNARSNK